MQKTLLAKSLVITIFVLFAVAAAVYGLRSSYTGTRQGKADENYIESENCLACHTDHYASWRRTHHGRMTQNISPQTVQGDFEKNNIFEYAGVKAKMERRGNEFFMSFQYPDGKVETNKIERTVGSRRIEQYVTKRSGQYFRLPVAYDLMQRRWMSLNGSFFYPDGGDFNQHTAQWDTNCVFCHNVKAQPNFDFQTRTAKTEVAELGIACGACHGPGAIHADLASSPLTRMQWQADESIDRKINNPQKLDTDRSMMICGHCHGQRVPNPTDRIRDIMAKGDPFDAGENLAEMYTPIDHGTKIGNVSFANRFWADGSPRLTAYEYQGILNSPCFLKGQPGNRINCNSCHTMHGGDVKGQITDELRTNVACTQCHTELRDDSMLAKHTKHQVNTDGSNCYSCHMPEVVYGIQTIHKTHQIADPQPHLTASRGLPNACNQCHLDKSVNWAIQKTRELWPEKYSTTTASKDAQFDRPEGERALFAGDALTRALTADALSRRADKNWAAPLLIEAFMNDNYPIVRYFAANGLDSFGWNIGKPDYLGPDAVRSQQIGLWGGRIDLDRREELKKAAAELRSLRRDVDIEVGE
jgi:predicted CXXCH cytochrome family protein